MTGMMIGLEMHVKLATETKLFCSDASDSAGYKPNTNVCPICMGMPGSKPALNKKALEQSVLAAMALNFKVNRTISFSRKTYFYPDLSKNFQITQYEMPVGALGCLETKGRKIRLARLQIEEDPAKTEHVVGNITNAEYTLIDYNRAGTPLIEIVTEPDLDSPAEARALVETIATMLDHIEVLNKEREASMRIDANISMEGGNRVEIKNITGAANVEKALLFEAARQRQILASGKVVQRETRHFDELTRTTAGLRTKETEEDYGYIFEPDLTFYQITDALMRAQQPKLESLPQKRIEKLIRVYSIPKQFAEIIVHEGKAFTDFYEACCSTYPDRIKLAKWVVGDFLKCLNWNKTTITKSKATKEGLVELLVLIDEGIITERLAKELIKEVVSMGKTPKKILKTQKLTKIDEGEAVKIIDQVIAENAEAFEDLKAGNKDALQYLIGKALAKTSNSLDPKLARKLLEAQIAQ